MSDADVRAYYAALDHDLLIYAIGLLAALAAAWAGFALTRRRGWLAAAITLTLVGGGLATAAQLYRASIPDRLSADLSAYTADPAAARADLAERYGPGRAVPHFRQLAIIWGVVAAVAGVVMAVVRGTVANGIGLAVLTLCAASFVLDLTAFLRDLRYAAGWAAGQ